MRILHINKFFDLQGGAEVYMHRLMEKQREAGHEVHAFSTRSARNLPSDDSKHFVTRFDLDKRESAAKDLQKAKNYLWNAEAKQEIEQLIAEVKPDVAHIHNLYHHLSSSVLAPLRAAKIPCVQTLHDYKLACPNYRMYTQGAPCERCKGGKYINAIKYNCLSAGLLPNVLAAFEMGMTKARQSYEKTIQFWLCPSHFMKEKMEDWSEPKDRMILAPNPAELASSSAARKGGYVLYAGRLSPEKGLSSFIRAAATMPELQVKIAGRGGEELGLKSLVRGLGATNIEFLGFQLPDDLALIRSRAEAIILPTLSYENCSTALLEAMADGLPCLATRIGGNPELVEDGVNGFLARPGDVEDWIHCLRRFLATTPEVRDKMGLAGREKIQNRHSWEGHLETVMETYDRAKKMLG